MDQITLSKSALEKFRTCGRCFWLEKRQGLKQPEGIRSGLPMGMDRVAKNHYDAWRAKGELPPEIREALPGWKLYDGKRISMSDLRNWRKGLTADCGDGVTLTGALDDLLYHPERKVYAMLDVKTKAKATNEADTIRYYGLQAETYDGNLDANGYQTEGAALFVYYYPVDFPAAWHAEETHGNTMMGWGVQPIWLRNLNRETPRKLARDAAAMLASDTPPNYRPGCSVCDYVKQRAAIGSAIAGKA